jgi:hypothetical protein
MTTPIRIKPIKPISIIWENLPLSSNLTQIKMSTQSAFKPFHSKEKSIPVN